MGCGLIVHAALFLLADATTLHLVNTGFGLSPDPLRNSTEVHINPQHPGDAGWLHEPETSGDQDAATHPEQAPVGAARGSPARKRWERLINDDERRRRDT